MRKLLFLTHRFPYPANKGDKIRALNILEHLSASFEVFLGCVDGDAEGAPETDWATKRGYQVYCGSSRTVDRLPRTAWSLLKGEPLSVGYFRHRGLLNWAQNVLTSERPQLTYVYSSAMAQYATGARALNSRVIMDFVDVDSVKWRQYSTTKKPPVSWIYALEAERLLRHDRAVAQAVDAALFVSATERDLFKAIAPEASAKLHVVPNGVDTSYFSPAALNSTSSRAGRNVVFVGVMDYWPNVEAVQWFARDVFPLVRLRYPDAHFQIVGSRPSASVRALETLPGVKVSGAVLDVRPFLHDARVVVTPLRIARGIQNKVLEGMAMARPIVTSPEALDGISARDQEHVLVASDADAFADAVIKCLSDVDLASAMGQRARAFVVEKFAWSAQMKLLDAIIAHQMT